MRFPEAPLKRFGRIVGGATPRSDDELWDGGVTWYTPTDVSQAHGGVLGESARTLSAAGAESCAVARIPPGSVVFTSRAPIGNVALADRACTTNQGCRTLIPDRETEPRFVLYCAMVRTAELRAIGTGTTFLEVSGERLRNVRFPRPDRRSQESIADFLDRECERIARLSQAVAALRDRAIAAHYESQVPQLLDGTPAVRLKYLVEPPSNGDWGGDPGTADADVRCVRVTDFDRERLVLRSEGVLRSYPAGKAARLRLRYGDLVLEKSGGGEKSPVGFVVQCRAEADGLAFSNFVARMRVRHGVLSDWLVHVFAVLYARRVNEQFVKRVTGIQNLDTAAYLNVRVPLPGLAEQRRLADAAQHGLDRALTLRAAASRLNDRLAEYRDALITEAVTGRLDVTNLSETQMEERLHATAEDAAPTGPLASSTR